MCLRRQTTTSMTPTAYELTLNNLCALHGMRRLASHIFEDLALPEDAAHHFELRLPENADEANHLEEAQLLTMLSVVDSFSLWCSDPGVISRDEALAALMDLHLAEGLTKTDATNELLACGFHDEELLQLPFIHFLEAFAKNN
mmetsp:Transcript_93061/g.300762  ORF Transcript_93061/g.300762 Transcript_93061/m.300762 type:complete len:143 (-) Transcript_93061:59-487(-)